MRKEEPVVELVPKNPFSWKIIALLVVAWLVVFFLMIELKAGVLRLLFPVIALILVAYLAYCTFVLLKNRK